jgi:hypothetical protein
MEKLGDRLAQGEQAAFAELYDACADRLHHYLTLRLGSREDADDVLQNTFVRLANARSRLAGIENLIAYVHALKTERVFAIESFGSFPWPTRLAFINDECDYLDLISEQLDFASRSYSDLAAAGLERKYQGRIGTLSQLVLPALLQCRKANERKKAQMRCLRVLNAVHRRADQGDQAESKLADLGLPPDASIDPFTGTPLRLQKTTEGWLVYSTGENLQDDGGDLSEHRDIGVGPNRVSRDNK